MPAEDFGERLIRLETQLAERYINTEERYCISEERYRITEERYRTMEERYRTALVSMADFTSRLSSIEDSIRDLPRVNGRDHLLHVGAASVGGGSIVAAIIELIKILTA